MAGANRIKPDAALETSASPTPKLPLHFMLVDKIVRFDRNVQEAVDGTANNIGMGSCQLGPLAGEAIGFGHSVDRRPDDRVIDWFGHVLAHEEDVHAPAAK